MRNATCYDRSIAAILYHTAMARIFLSVFSRLCFWGGSDEWDVALTLCIESLDAREMQLVLVLYGI